MSLVTKLASNIRRMAGFAASTSLVQLLYLIFSARHFGPEVIGSYAIWLALMSSVNVLISSPVYQLVMEDGRQSVPSVQIVGAAASLIPGFILPPLYVWLMPGDLSITASILALSFLWSSTETAAQANEARLLREERLIRLGFSQLLASLVQIVSLGIVVYFEAGGINAVILLTVILNVSRIVLTQEVRRGEYDLRGVSSSLFRYARYLNLSSLVTIYASQADRAIIGASMGIAAAGYYSRAISLAQVPSTLFARFGSKALLSAGLNTPKGPNLVRELSSVLLAVGLLLTACSVIFSIFSRDILRILFGLQWESGYLFLQIMAFSAFPRVVVKICDNILRSYKELAVLRNAYLSYAGIVTFALLALLLYPGPILLIGLVLAIYAAAAVFYLGAARSLAK